MDERIRTGGTVWLVTRHWRGDYARSEVATIFSGRLGALRVREFVELLGVTTYYTLKEQAAMRWPREEKNRHSARCVPPKDANSSECEIFFGDDPYLYARRVDNFTVNGDGAVWRERPRHQIALTAKTSH
jgi:hypothetical protein